jgi:shikimate dehydrogenase
VAEALGAVNCVFRRAGRLVGDNTDGPGFIEALAVDEGVDVAGRRCALLGAGGAGRAVAHALGEAGAAEVVVVNRSPGPARRAADLAGPVGRVGVPGDVTAADLVVNATPLGMAGGPGPGAVPVEPDLLRDGQVVVDLVYHPAETPLLAVARARGARPVNGVGMLVHQAAHAFVRWTGHRAPLREMTAAIRAELASRAATDGDSSSV